MTRPRIMGSRPIALLFLCALFASAVQLTGPAALAASSPETNTRQHILKFPTAATPTFSPASGTYTSKQTVRITAKTPLALIFYTTNGSEPTIFSKLYILPIQISTTTTIKAIAVAIGYTNSAVASATYTINIPTATATPTFSPAGGTYTSKQTVTLSDATSGAKIYYTTNGTAPTTSSTLYSTPIAVSATTTIKAIAVATGHTNSAVATALYTINITNPTAATPIFSPVAGTYTSAQNVTISDTTSGAKIYYTTNGNTPTTSSTLYSTPISVTATTTIKAITVAIGYTNSAVASATYTINIPTADAPTFLPVAGTYTSTQNVTLSDTTSGAKIYYTTDGTAPTTASTLYSTPIAVSATTTIKAIAVAIGYMDSAVASATYTINIPTDGNLIRDDIAWGDFFAIGDGSVVTSDKVVGANSEKIATQQRSNWAGVYQDMTANPVDLSNATLRFYVKSSDWNSIKHAVLILGSDNWNLTNTFTYDLSSSLQNPVNNEWIEVVVPRDSFNADSTSADWTHIDFAFIKIMDNGSAAADLSIDGLSYF